jgi:hypothetical protein
MYSASFFSSSFFALVCTAASADLARSVSDTPGSDALELSLFAAEFLQHRAPG